jgi:hypothetical protein
MIIPIGQLLHSGGGNLIKGTLKPTIHFPKEVINTKECFCK